MRHIFGMRPVKKTVNQNDIHTHYLFFDFIGHKKPSEIDKRIHK